MTKVLPVLLVAGVVAGAVLLVRKAMGAGTWSLSLGVESLGNVIPDHETFRLGVTVHNDGAEQAVHASSAWARVRSSAEDPWSDWGQLITQEVNVQPGSTFTWFVDQHLPVGMHVEYQARDADGAKSNVIARIASYV